jgi:hypothetical protein
MAGRQCASQGGLGIRRRSLLTGLVQSLGTTWGLFQHHWVVFKLAITVFATAVLLLHLRTFATMADAAADPSVELVAVRNSYPLLHAVLALVRRSRRWIDLHAADPSDSRPDAEGVSPTAGR